MYPVYNWSSRAPAQQPTQPSGPFTRTTKFNDLPDGQKKIFEELEWVSQATIRYTVPIAFL